MTNLLQGQFFQQGVDDAPGFGRLMGHRAVPGKKRLDRSAQVVASKLLDLSVHADPLALNTLACTLREVLLGEISLCRLEPAQLPSQRTSCRSAWVEDRGQPTGALSTLFRYQIGRLSICDGRKLLLN